MTTTGASNAGSSSSFSLSSSDSAIAKIIESAQQSLKQILNEKKKKTDTATASASTIRASSASSSTDATSSSTSTAGTTKSQAVATAKASAKTSGVANTPPLDPQSGNSSSSGAYSSVISLAALQKVYSDNSYAN